MIEQLESEYLNEYFRKLKSFRLIENFRLKNEDQINNPKASELYSGTIEAIDTIHPLLITVEIPKAFPHHKLVFWTESLKGYPHLIYNSLKKSSWFCLNTPFAETIEEQLNQEINRLDMWIKRQIHPDLEPIISNSKVVSALRKMNAYEWENPDEISEYNQDCMLTFIGEFGQNVHTLLQEKGFLHCIRNGSNRFYACNNKDLANTELPYIIVDSLPENPADFLQMKEQYGWDDSISTHLLPKIELNKFETSNSSNPELSYKFQDDIKQPKWDKSIYYQTHKRSFNNYNSDSILNDMRISKEEAIEKIDNAIKTLIIPDNFKDIFIKTTSELKDTIKNAEKKSFDDLLNKCDDDDDDDYHYWVYENELFHCCLQYFALGVKLEDNNISWRLFATNNASRKYDITKYNIDICDIIINTLSSLKTQSYPTQNITEKEYFGRGKFSNDLSGKRIALIGLGAIGSMTAESLVRSGVKELAIWDNDTVEPGNICRSTYSLKDLGESKVDALASKLKSISPECKITRKGNWTDGRYINGPRYYQDGDYYSSINYTSQAETIKQLESYDLVIDCTASNELLHFLSYALTNKDLISLCITNHAQNLICVTNKDDSPFELRKHILAKIEQDTKNLYTEGTGCYSPTFLAKNCDIAALVNLAIREIDLYFQENKLLPSIVWSYSKRGIVADKQLQYRLEDNPQITLSISRETLMDGEELFDTKNKYIGYILGGYNKDGSHIYVSHIIEAQDAEQSLINIHNRSNGIIDYIGDFSYSWEKNMEIRDELTNSLAIKAIDEQINTNNPLLVTRNIDGSLSFYLYINNDLSRFIALTD